MDIKATVIKRLKSIGIDVEDDFLIDFSIDKNKHYILNQTNQVEIPKELFEVWVDRSVADVLQVKYSTNTLDIDSINIEPVISRIQEGDTTVDIATAKDGGLTDEDRFLHLLEELRKPDFSYARFRRFKW